MHTRKVFNPSEAPLDLVFAWHAAAARVSVTWMRWSFSLWARILLISALPSSAAVRRSDVSADLEEAFARYRSTGGHATAQVAMGAVNGYDRDAPAIPFPFLMAWRLAFGTGR
jgi:hypothetical protein